MRKHEAEGDKATPRTDPRSQYRSGMGAARRHHRGRAHDGGSALWLPDRAPTMLGMPHTVESAPASSQEYSGTQQVNVVPTIAADRQLPGNATGTMTENWMAGELRSGSAPIR